MAGDAGEAGTGTTDGCPSDPAKTEPGVCGCGTPDTDTDKDGTPNCTDSCPNDAAKVMPGTCGCGVPDQDTATVAGCVALKAALVHRYSFSGSGATATDSVGTAHGTIVNTTLTNTGALTLAGGSSDQFVDLPNGIISSLGDATFEAWLTWTGGAIWQRIFDFGNTATEGSQGTGMTYLFFTPKDGLSTRTLRAVYSTSGTTGEIVAASPSVLPSGTASHVTVVVNDTSNLITVYVNGLSVGTPATFAGHLSSINDINNWLGRSQFADAALAASLTEFRIYNAALTAKQVTLTQSSGPDPAFLP
jgi:hypothetical protein